MTKKITHMAPSYHSELRQQCLYLCEQGQDTEEGIRVYMDKTNPDAIKAYIFPEETDDVLSCIAFINKIHAVNENVHCFLIRLVPEPLTVQRTLYLPERDEP